jgi:phosphoserine phosphatase
LQPICNQLGIKYLIASNINSKTGKHIGKNCHGDEKVIRYKQVFKNKKIATFYTDSLSDKPLINIASKSFIVRKNKIIKYEDYRVILSTKIKNLFFERDFIIFIFCGGMGTLSNFIVSLIISSIFIQPLRIFVDI